MTMTPDFWTATEKPTVVSSTVASQNASFGPEDLFNESKAYIQEIEKRLTNETIGCFLSGLEIMINSTINQHEALDSLHYECHKNKYASPLPEFEHLITQMRYNLIHRWFPADRKHGNAYINHLLYEMYLTVGSRQDYVIHNVIRHWQDKIDLNAPPLS